MIDHIGLEVKDFAKAKAFYAKALVPIGYSCLMEFDFGAKVAGFGAGRKPDFWIEEGDSTRCIHVAFATDDPKVVDAFHAAALKAGGKDNGKPGLRPEYHPHYYGAFVIDPEGHNIEVCCHSAGAAKPKGKAKAKPKATKRR